jgi:hypothetical protein
LIYISQVKLRKEFSMLQTIPGIGNILGLTIMLEVGDIWRFPKVGDYSSYNRCVDSKRLSNGKKKGENKKKNGNKYLSPYNRVLGPEKRNLRSKNDYFSRFIKKKQPYSLVRQEHLYFTFSDVSIKS